MLLDIQGFSHMIYQWIKWLIAPNNDLSEQAKALNSNLQTF